MEIGEAIKISNKADVAKEDSCPFCHDKPVGHRTHHNPDLTAVPESKPAALGCKTLPVVGTRKYATAAHHLIPAKQSYARVRRLLRMGNSVGYDINNRGNGTPLPTVANVEHEVKYGDLSSAAKQEFADGVMAATGKQWHVGHHSFESTLTVSWVNESGQEEVAHNVSYDTSVILRLLTLCDQAAQSLCEKTDCDDSFKQKMEEISRSIDTHLGKFGGDDPMDSRPFFVSARAYEYAQKRSGKSHGR